MVDHLDADIMGYACYNHIREEFIMPEGREPNVKTTKTNCGSCNKPLYPNEFISDMIKRHNTKLRCTECYMGRKNITPHKRKLTNAPLIKAVLLTFWDQRTIHAFLFWLLRKQGLPHDLSRAIIKSNEWYMPWLYRNKRGKIFVCSKEPF